MDKNLFHKAIPSRSLLLTGLLIFNLPAIAETGQTKCHYPHAFFRLRSSAKTSSADVPSIPKAAFIESHPARSRMLVSFSWPMLEGTQHLPAFKSAMHLFTAALSGSILNAKL